MCARDIGSCCFSVAPLIIPITRKKLQTLFCIICSLTGEKQQRKDCARRALLCFNREPPSANSFIWSRFAESIADNNIRAETCGADEKIGFLFVFSQPH
jgi:hypothetical protein